MKKYIILTFLLLCLQNNLLSQELLPANQNTLDSLKQAYKGKVLFINFWATWCKPCVEEFPDIMELNSEYKDKDFKLIFVTLDFGDDFPLQTKKFLKKMNVDFTTYFNAFKKDDELINYMDKDWDGGIPGTFIFNKEGKLKKTFIGKTNYSEFKEAVDKNIN